MWWYWYHNSSVSTQQLVADARQALRNADYAQAEARAARALQLGSKSTAAMLIAGEAAAKRNRLQEAVAYYSQVPDSGNEVTFRALSSKAEALYQLGLISESEAVFRRTLEIEPLNEVTNHRFAVLLNVTGRRWEARSYLLNLVRLGKFSVEELCLLADSERPVDFEPQIARALEAVPEDPLALLGRVRLDVHKDPAAPVADSLWKIVRARPDNLDAQGLLGEVLARGRSDREFDDWRIQLPKEAERHPAVWFARGVWSEERGGLERAARCYWEAIRIEPDQVGANDRIAAVLKSLGREKLGVPFSDRALLIGRFNEMAFQIHREGSASKRVSQIAEMAEDMGRYWEAWAWNVVWERQGSDEASAARDRLRKLLDKENPQQTATKFNPALQIDLSHYPLPR